MYSSPTVLIFSTPAAAASSSKRVNSASRKVTTAPGSLLRTHGVNPSRSANRTVVSGYDSAIRSSPRWSLAAIDAGIAFVSSSLDRASARRRRTSV